MLRENPLRELLKLAGWRSCEYVIQLANERVFVRGDGFGGWRNGWCGGTGFNADETYLGTQSEIHGRVSNGVGVTRYSRVEIRVFWERLGRRRDTGVTHVFRFYE